MALTDTKRAQRFPLGASVTLRQLAEEPVAVPARLLREEPVSWCPDAAAWLVAPHTRVDEVIRDSTRFTPDHEDNTDRAVLGATMLTVDGPAHDVNRRPFDATLRVRHVRGHYTQVVDRCVDGVLAGLERDGGRDLMGDLAVPVALRVVGDVLGFDYPDTQALKDLTERLAEAMLFHHDAEHRKDAYAVVEAFRPEVMEALRTAREQASESVLGTVAREYADEVDETIIVNNTVNLIFGGTETTATLCGTSLWALLRHPEQLAQVREDRSLLGSAIDEAARWHAPFGATLRWAREDTTLGGVDIHEGERLYPLLMAANRDPTMFADPDRYDLHRRNARRSISFGKGLHFCIGQNVAKLTAERMLDAALTRLPGLRLDPERPSHPVGFEFHRLPRLDVLWDVDSTEVATR